MLINVVVTGLSSKSKDDLLISLDSISFLGKDIGLIITKSNADDGGRILNQEIDNFVNQNKNSMSYNALGQFLYYNCINNVDCVVGNSSSGLFEVPTFKKATVNIGDRQKGRIRSKSVIDCDVNKEEIISSIKKAFNLNCENVINPYGQGNTSNQIVKILEDIDIKNISLQKHFYNL